MRYRPFRAAGGSISAVSLAPTAPSLSDDEREQLFQACLVAGVNGYEVAPGDAGALAMLGDALRSYDRDLVLVSARVGTERQADGGVARDYTPARIMAQVEAATRQLDLGPLDLVTLDSPSFADLSPELIDTLRQAHAVGMMKAIGVRTEGADAEPLVRCGAFQVLHTRFSLLSGWPERNLIRLAIASGMTVSGYGFTGDERQAESAGGAQARRGFLGLGRRKAPALAQADGYGFLRTTHGWSEETICLAYALTEPSLSTVQVQARSPDQIAALGAVSERDLPANLAAQIEMARFSAVA